MKYHVYFIVTAPNRMPGHFDAQISIGCPIGSDESIATLRKELRKVITEIDMFASEQQKLHYGSEPTIILCNWIPLE